MNIECSYDPEANAAYVYLAERSPTRRVARTRFCDIPLEGAAINVDFDEDGKVVGFELLGARSLLPHRLLE